MENISHVESPAEYFLCKYLYYVSFVYMLLVFTGDLFYHTEVETSWSKTLSSKSHFYYTSKLNGNNTKDNYFE